MNRVGMIDEGEMLSSLRRLLFRNHRSRNPNCVKVESAPIGRRLTAGPNDLSDALAFALGFNGRKGSMMPPRSWRGSSPPDRSNFTLTA